MTRKKLIIPIALLLLTSLSFQSCIGSFSLTNKVLQWNRNVSNKFVNELVFFAFWILPVYEVTSISDLLIINSIEFWSGNKPLESNNQVIKTEHGNYQIFANENGYDILSPDGKKIKFSFDVESQTWSFISYDGIQKDFLKFVDNNHVEMLNTNGEFVDVELSESGVNKFKTENLSPMMAFK